MVNTVEKIEYINCKLNGTNPNCTSSIRVESWDKNFAIRMNKSNNNLQQKLQSPSGPLAAVCSKLKEDIKRWDFWKPTKMPNIKQKVALITGKLSVFCTPTSSNTLYFKLDLIQTNLIFPFCWQFNHFSNQFT